MGERYGVTARGSPCRRCGRWQRERHRHDGFGMGREMQSGSWFSSGSLQVRGGAAIRGWFLENPGNPDVEHQAIPECGSAGYREQGGVPRGYAVARPSSVYWRPFGPSARAVGDFKEDSLMRIPGMLHEKGGGGGMGSTRCRGRREPAKARAAGRGMPLSRGGFPAWCEGAHCFPVFDDAPAAYLPVDYHSGLQ